MMTHSSCLTIRWMTCPIRQSSRTHIVSRSLSRVHRITTRYSVTTSGQTGGLPIWAVTQERITTHRKRLRSPSMMRWGRSWSPGTSNLTPLLARERTSNTRYPSMTVLAHFSMHYHLMQMVTRGLLPPLITWVQAIRTLN